MLALGIPFVLLASALSKELIGSYVPGILIGLLVLIVGWNLAYPKRKDDAREAERQLSQYSRTNIKEDEQEERSKQVSRNEEPTKSDDEIRTDIELETNYCYKCGRGITSGMAFCPRCGHKLS